MKLKTKQGYQLVEASIVMPLIILLSVSTIFLVVFLYECLNRQCSIHEELITIENNSKELYKKEELREVEEGLIRGLADYMISKELYSSRYLINECMIIRIGDKGYEFQE